MDIQKFKAALRQQGITIRRWAEIHDFPVDAVYRALNGLDKGYHGRAHDILVAAGVKDVPTERRVAERRDGERRQGDRRAPLAA